jgi:hypothetical protein
VFVERDQSNKAGGIGEKLDRFGWLHPLAFDGLLVVLMIAITVVLLSRTGYPLVLYQGF